MKRKKEYKVIVANPITNERAKELIKILSQQLELQQ